MRPVRRLAHAQGDERAGRDRGDRAEDEDEADPAEVGRPERPDGRTQEQAAHLGRAVQPERLAALARWRRVGQVAAGGGVVDRGTQPGPGAEQDEGQRRGQHQRERPEHPGRHEADGHHRHAAGAVGDPAEDRFADEPGGRPGRDDEAERGQVDALLREVDRQDREQATEPEPHDEFGHEQRGDGTPLVEPGSETGGLGKRGHGFRGGRDEAPSLARRAGQPRLDAPVRTSRILATPPRPSPSRPSAATKGSIA